MRIHRNLHNARKGGPQWVETEKGRVKQYLPSALLVSVSTRIQPAGVAKCQESQVRSVCAFFDGLPGDSAFFEKHGVLPSLKGFHKVSFDPRKDDHFMAQGERWNRASAAFMAEDGTCHVLNPRWEA